MDNSDIISLLVEIKGELGEVKGLVAAAAVTAARADHRVEKLEGRTSALENGRYWLLGAASAAGACFGLIPHLIDLLHP